MIALQVACQNLGNGTRICTQPGQPFIPDWLYYGWITMMITAILVAFLLMAILYWAGPVGRRFIRNRGPSAFITYPDNTYDFVKVRRIANFLKIKSKRFNTFAYAGEGSAFIRAAAPQIYLVDARAKMAVPPKVVQYGDVISGDDPGAGDFIDPENTPDSAPQEIGELALTWYRGHLKKDIYVQKVKRALTLPERSKLAADPEAQKQYNDALEADKREETLFNQKKENELALVEEVLYGTPAKAGESMDDQDKQEVVERAAAVLANQRRSVWPAVINGVVWDARRILRWALSNVTPDDAQNLEIIARNEERLDAKSGNNKMLMMVFVAMAIVVVVLIAAKAI